VSVASLAREALVERVRRRERPWDLLVIGGGATGAGVAVDAASRGYEVLLLEQADFGKGTSSRSTKLIHGGVRYLQQGNVALVLDSLRERGRLMRNAPHLVRPLDLVVPAYAWWERPYYAAGLTLYDALAGRARVGRSRRLSREEVLARLPTLEREGLRGGVAYRDAQFDDARLLLALVRTAADHGALALNRARVAALCRDGAGRIDGVVFRDEESGETHEVHGRVVVNATGPFSDAVRRLDEPRSEPLLAPSQGVHVTLPAAALPDGTALLVPRTSDGRVLFAVPWHGRVIAGTTDTAIDEIALEPEPRPGEIEFILDTAKRYLLRAVGRADVCAVFTGIRPLVRGSTRATAALDRDHTIVVSTAGLLTITGGKWTTYRRMAEDTVDRAIALAGLPQRPCRTRDLAIHGKDPAAERHGALAPHGSDAPALAALIAARPVLGERLHPRLPYVAGEIVWAARHEMARTLDDVLSRRLRATVLDVRAALEAAPAAVELLAAELGRDAAWSRSQLADFAAVAERHTPPAR
jgi:glycerol-3-phosphate dehydrogenase